MRSLEIFRVPAIFLLLSCLTHNSLPKVMEQVAIIYNASGTFFGELKYIVGKACGITKCGACDITHSLSEMGEKEAFAQLRKTFPIPLKLYHTNEIPEYLQHLATTLPVVIHVRKDNEPTILFEAQQLNAMKGSVQVFQRQLEKELEISR